MHNRLHDHFKTHNGRTRSRTTAEAVAAADTPVEAIGGENLARRATRSLASHPAIAIGAAFAVGLLIGKWVKR